MITAPSSPAAEPQISAWQQAALRSLLYFDLFQFPLTGDELVSLSPPAEVSNGSHREAIQKLVNEGIVFTDGRFYSVQSDSGIFKRRHEGSERATQLWNKVSHRSGLIAAFPFVRSVCISGSYSKGYFDDTTDVDFFIITEPGRLWVCRTLLVLYKKIFLLNSKKFFCVNYFIDASALEIPDKNIFTATELVTLLPVYNHSLYLKFFSANAWVQTYFPGRSPRLMREPERKPLRLMKSIAEFVLGGYPGDWLDKVLLKFTLSHWQRKFGGQTPGEFEVNMRSQRSVSKHHPQGFQFRVLKAFEERMRQFEDVHGIDLSVIKEVNPV